MMHRRVWWVACLAVSMMGCGNDATNPADGEDPEQTPTPSYGYFLDDAVIGLGYDAGDGVTRQTDEYGAFRIMAADSPIRFFIGNVDLGSVSPRTRITPNEFGSSGLNIARLLQSLDTAPNEAGIDVSGLSLATAIDFHQSESGFSMDPAVQAAVQVAAQAGGSGVLVTGPVATAHLRESIGGVFEVAELANRAIYPVDPEPGSEPCLVILSADGTGRSVCRDDVEDGYTVGQSKLAWRIEGGAVVVEYDYGSGVEERVTAEKLGTTGGQVSAQVTTECLTCDPDVEPAVEGSVQTFVYAFPLSTASFAGRVFSVETSEGSVTATFQGDGTGTLDDGQEVQTFRWDVDAGTQDVLVMHGTGAASSQLFYGEMFLVEGTSTDGVCLASFATAFDLDGDGEISGEEFLTNGVYDSMDRVVVRLEGLIAAP
ncbi:MAG: hypothetical protein R3E12_14715 [Candidatus Eisenbacteria bacterium]